ncbi:hypothetical protein KHA80_00060 [Anaerobacillus sp. HL2]|nr:hypothetical protein KHA80_00060 [Anaerobacillus sp. HL2]
MTAKSTFQEHILVPFTSEEVITSSFVKNENPDVIINIVDATNFIK